MKFRQFGKTDLQVSEIGFGAWGIGGPAMAGSRPIGWGKVDDAESLAALHAAAERGVNFIDTADFYGLGHSETLIGRAFGNRPDMLIATKVGHRLDRENRLVLDYSRAHIIAACEASLRRLRRDTIDYYQLHSAKVPHLENGECLEAMIRLQEQGKIRYWGVSLNTFNPFPEAEFLLQRGLGDGLQLVFNIINQRATGLLARAAAQGYGIIARMPLQFGLLAGKFNRHTRFPADDHRHFRLNPALLAEAEQALAPVWQIQQRLQLTPVAFSLSFVLSFPAITTVIPGIKTVQQAIENTVELASLPAAEVAALQQLYEESLSRLVKLMEAAE
ncbi:MAG: aldo/keto reductase [candidate division KSB1 bacterium]|nr:aldo/keto reductase [candidate division KSB1 bacterium]MDZ7276244.1 aldo/keto reductase [candidate division KSB1 bacterium]MDZ7287950.1 aldo/keto reductase [candidate division KSB1 bacterium]MDZ7300037.1 aldo/keto reductase [candidate division KSB1 bacterium]MDZ7308427.1 aldo/keto reductase [candidate division KSB1 bacterium]